LNKYIGIPFEDKRFDFNGCDCYGLVSLIYKQDLNIDLPVFGKSCYDTKGIWLNYLKHISELWTLVKEPQKYDVIAMAHDPQHPKIIQHFGVYMGDGIILHTLEKIGSHPANIQELNYYIKGIYRWKQN